MLSAAAESFVGKWWHGFVAWLCLKFLRAHRISFPYVSHHLMISLQNLQPSHWYPVHISLRDAGGWCAWWGCGRWGGSSCVNASHQSYSSSGHVELALLLVKEACQLVLGPWGRSIFRFHNYGRKRKSFLHLFQTWGKLSKVPRASPSWKMDWNMRQFFFCFSGPLLQVLVACLDRLADQAFLVCVTRWISKSIVPKSRKTRIQVSIDDDIN